MDNTPLPLPAGACGKCGRAVLALPLPATPCANRLPEGTCNGSFRVTRGESDWSLCTHCHGAGNANGQHCAVCDGIGWNYARPQFP